MLTPYTTSEQVRAVFGVTEEELTDATLDLPLYESGLRNELAAIGASCAADYKTVADIATASLTTVQQNFIDAVVLFAPVAVGSMLAQSLPLLVVKSVTDGKAGIIRHSDSPFEGVINACRKNYERYRQGLGKAYAAYKVQVAPFVLLTPITFVGAAPSSDPVTNK